VDFASDGGGMSYCFDTRGPETRIGTIDMMLIGSEELRYIATSFRGFLKALHDSSDPWSL
jgi:hypothetical protein